MVQERVAFPVQVFCDFLVISKKKVRLFVLCNVDYHPGRIGDAKTKKPKSVGERSGIPSQESWTFRVYEYQGGQGSSKESANENVPGLWTEEETLEVAFREPFHVFPFHVNYFFVTASGKVYHSEKPATKELRRIKPVWTDPEKRVTHVVADVDTGIGLTFVFGKWPGQGKYRGARFFFQLVHEKPNVNLLQAKDLRPVAAEEPLASIVQYGGYMVEFRAKLQEALTLAGDRRLQAQISLVADNPDFKTILRELEKATGLTLTVAPNLADHQPQLGSVQLPNAPAHMVMRFLAASQLDGGRWQRTDHGYRLVAKASLVQKEKKAQEDEAQELLKKDPFYLSRDPNLLKIVSISELNPRVRDMLRKLSEATRLQITLADNLAGHQPEYGYLHFPDTAAWVLMELIAKMDVENGRWEKTETGYRLTGTPSQGSGARGQESGAWW
jgi:hypothetical protein